MLVGDTRHVQLGLDGQRRAGRDRDRGAARVRRGAEEGRGIVGAASSERACTRRPSLEGGGDGHRKRDTCEQVGEQDGLLQDETHG